MIRKIIHIDQEKCNGCGACASACHEGAIGMVEGKATLLRDDYCDGLGDCLPTCPTGAISFVHREAAAYDEAAVQANMKAKKQARPHAGGCPGQQMRSLQHTATLADFAPAAPMVSRLAQWPCQIKLAPVNAPFFAGAHLLIAADCTAYAYPRMHDDFMKGRITLVGCPKLDDIDYSIKLAEIFKANTIQTVTLTRMEVPCCGGMEFAIRKALQASGKAIPFQVATIAMDGRVLDISAR